MGKTITLVECPRDAMQGWKTFIPTDRKIEYIDSLMQVGFDVLDFGSFVSPKAIPQMADTREVLAKIDDHQSQTRLLAITANLRGALDAMPYERISFLGFPFSVSPSFQLRNTNSSMSESLKTVEDIQNLCVQRGKSLVVYISMGFGNPYGDPFSPDIVFEWTSKIAALGVQTISLADTVGLAAADQVFQITQATIRQFPDQQIGVHLHSSRAGWKVKIDAALRAGCTRFDGALNGIGGCPMANDELVGNMDTGLMIPYFKELGILRPLNQSALDRSLVLASEIFA